MELFSINRYTVESEVNVKQNEGDILAKLLKKVEKRKRKTQNEEKVATNGEEEQTHIEKKSKRNAEAEAEAEVAKALDIRETTPPYDAEDPIHDNDAANEVAYEVLGEQVNLPKTQRVDMVLPAWLAHPSIISSSLATETDNTTNAIENLAYLTTATRNALKELHITRLFPVQVSVIPWILEAHAKPAPFRPRDICVSAPTGSGKTLAFAIPVVQLLEQRVQRRIRALVVLPVAELALQVYKVFKKLCEKTDLSVCLLSKQMQFTKEQSKLVEYYKGQYYSKVDIVVTTPGRLVDHIHATKGFCLKSLQFLVIDEADRIMDAVFQNWLYHLDAHVRATTEQLLSGHAAPLCYNELLQSAGTQPHKLLFSATLSQDPEKLQSLRLFQPKLFTSTLPVLQPTDEGNIGEKQQENIKSGAGEFIGKYTTPAELTEKYCITESRLKPLTLFALIQEHQWRKFLCFTNSGESANRLTFVLKEICKHKPLVLHELSASKGAKDRSQLLSQFARGKINGLICSDALARGIDIPDVDVVISYDPPRHIKTYIHRIGRTARAGRRGTAVTLLTQNELTSFNHTLSEAGKSLTEEISVSATLEEENAHVYKSALSALRNKLEMEKRAKVLLKERAKSLAQSHKNTSELTLMEKLQAQATVEALNDVQNAESKPKVVYSRKEAKRNKGNKSNKTKQHKGAQNSQLNATPKPQKKGKKKQ